MPTSRSSRRVVVLGLTMWIVSVLAGVSRAQFLKPGKTAPAPEFRGVTRWVNSHPLIDCPGRVPSDVERG